MHQGILSRTVPLLVLAASTLAATASLSRAQVAPEQLCQKGRYDAAAKYQQCGYKALGKHFAVNDFAKLNRALSKCRVKYTGTWVKLQRRALGTGSTCDAPRFVTAGSPSKVVDNLTGLEWEMKTDIGPLTGVDNRYDWGDAINYFLSGASGVGISGMNEYCVYGRCDWRLPTVMELQTILAEPYSCTTSPCIDADFGPTAAVDHWSGTVLGDNPNYAWVVDFGTGEVSYDVMSVTNAVRAVRGGL